ILKAHMERKPVPPIELVPDSPPDLSAIIEKSLEKKPAARFQTADDFRAALQALNLQKPPDPDSTPTATLEVPSYAAASRASSRKAKTWDAPVLESARKKLAAYIGPMAKVFVARAAKKSRSVDDLY